MKIEEYLDQINEDTENESVGGFAIDSFPTRASKRPLPVVYPESVDLDTNYDIDKPRILIDFDQTIHKYSVGWIDDIIYDSPISGVKQVIEFFRNSGYEVVIFTCRLSESAHGKQGVEKQRKLIQDWLKKYDIEVDGMTAEKLPASVYIDDRAYEFKGQWDKETITEIKKKIEEDLKEY
jgi:hypothetical protein